VLCHVVDLGRAAGLTMGEPLLMGDACEALEGEGEYDLEDATKRVGAGVKVSSQKGEGAPIAEIVRLASEIKPRFIVMGSHGRSGFKRFFVGSVAEGVARDAGVPVMIVPMEHAVAA
jgi:nucleotide-binding universal stress UspA family protein